jgi:hypothetical protein
MPYTMKIAGATIQAPLGKISTGSHPEKKAMSYLGMIHKKMRLQRSF